MKKIAFLFLAMLPLLASAATSLGFTVGNVNYEPLGGVDPLVTVTGLADNNVSSVTIPSTVSYDGVTYGVRAISSDAFLNNTNLVSVEIKSGVETIAANSFAGCTNLKSISFPGTLKAIFAPTFSGQVGAFEGCTALETIVLPASMDYQGEVDATAPHNICKWAFKDCTNLKVVVINAKSPYIEDEAFINCSSLQYFVSYNTQPYSLESNTFKGIPSTAKLIVPDGTKSSYQALLGWDAFKNIDEHSNVDLKAILGEEDQPQDGGTAKLLIEAFDIKASETKTMVIDMQNPDDKVTLVQFDLRLPDGLSIASGDDAVDIAGRTTLKKHTLTSNAVDGITRFLLYSATNAQIEGTSGAIISVKLTASSSFNGGDIKLENQLMTTPDLVESKPSTYTYNIKGGNDNPPVGDGEPYVVYNDGTLTFYCDNQRSSRQGTVYDLDQLNNGIPAWLENKETITKAIFDPSFANVKPNTTARWFWGCSSMTVIEGITYLNTSDVEKMNGMFLSCRGLTSLDVSKFNTCNVTNMGSMFMGCSGLTSLDVSKFNTSNVTNMANLFDGCSNLSSLDVSNFNTSNVLSIGRMLNGCSGLLKLTIGNGFATTEEVRCSDAFANCNNLNSVVFTGDIPSSINSKFFEGVGTASSPATLEVPEQYRDHYAAKFDGNMFFGGYFKLSDDIVVQAPLEMTFNILNAVDGIVYYNVPRIKMTWKNITDKEFKGDEWCSCYQMLDNGEWSEKVFTGQSMGITLKPGKEGGLKQNLPVFHENRIDNVFEDGFYKWEWGYKEENDDRVNVGSLVMEVRNHDGYRAIWLEDETMATFCDDSDLDFSRVESVKVYIATGFNASTSEVKMQQVNDAPAGTGLMIVGKPGCYLAERKTSNSTFTSNLLVGVLGDSKRLEPVADGFTNYLFRDNSQKFIIAGDMGYSNVYENEAYLRVPTQEAGDIQTITPVFNEPTISSEAYAVFDDFTLSFYYDDQRSKRSGTVYSLNEGENDPEWVVDDNNRNVEKVVFDASFANARPTTTYRWFLNCDILREIEGIENLNTSEVKNMQAMFSLCGKLKSIDVSHFDTRTVQNMGAMFSFCTSLESIDVSHFNSDNVWSMASMFNKCQSLTEINLSSFNTSKVEYLFNLFAGCSNLRTIYFGNGFTSTNNVSCEEAFVGCQNLSKVVFTGDIPASINSTFFDGVGTANAPVKLDVPEQYTENYEAKFDGNIFYGGYFVLREAIVPNEEDGGKDYGNGNGEIDEHTDLNGSIIGNVYYNIAPEYGGYNSAEGCLVVTQPSSEDAFNAEDPFL